MAYTIHAYTSLAGHALNSISQHGEAKLGQLRPPIWRQTHHMVFDDGFTVSDDLSVLPSLSMASLPANRPTASVYVAEPVRRRQKASVGVLVWGVIDQ